MRGAGVLACAAVLLPALAACSGDVTGGRGGSGGSGSAEGEHPEPAPTAVTRTVPRAGGPAADLSAELTGGRGVFIGAPTPADLEPAGYVQHEYAAVGTATSYRAAGELTPDGRWTFATDTTAPYRTRVLVRRPAAADRFSGTVIVEWLNVSGGVDADPEWTTLQEEITRRGDVWVGVSAQRIGVLGGPVLVTAPGGEGVSGRGLRALDPARYGSLSHPGDGYSFDIYTQVARAVGAGAGLGGAKPSVVVAAGESQSAAALVTYYNGVQPLTREFDGFFVHSRGSAGLPLVTGDQPADLAGALQGTPTIFRTDLDAPVLNPQTESDLLGVLNSYKARQPDGDRFRLWEVAGTAHADAHLLGPNASAMNCGVPVNDGPMHVVGKAGLRALKTWITTGRAPEVAPRIEVTAGGTPAIRRDSDGIAVGGIRTPPVDVPTAVLTGEPGPDASIICLLLGSTKPLPAARLAALYSDRDVYQQRYDAAVEHTVSAGYALADDRAALAGFAGPDALG
ncbi:alpha/beta hydrolase domain-containing protein [Frankia sp. EI5c]|uniref:alpha/beta hydrolase domain-containing protein n=1 Tax=Frankia sp. EI5c TaxID=683316 RepID=UPI0037C08654